MSDLLFTPLERAEANAKQKSFCENFDILTGALPRYRAILADFDALMRSNKIDEARELEARADELAIELWGERCGCVTVTDALAEATKAEVGKVPMWGQAGDFVATIMVGSGVRVRFEIDGLFGIGSPFGFSIHAVDFDKPFFSGTGYRSFVGHGLGLESVPVGWTVGDYVSRVLLEHFKGEMKGKLERIGREYRPCNGCGKTHYCVRGCKVAAHPEREIERFYLLDVAYVDDKPVGNLEGYEDEAEAMRECTALRKKAGKGANGTIVCRGPYKRAVFLEMLERRGWELTPDGVRRTVKPVVKPEPVFCEGCGETVAACLCKRCEECGLELELCECDETPERIELESEPEPPAIAPIAEPEQLSLF